MGCCCSPRPLPLRPPSQGHPRGQCLHIVLARDDGIEQREASLLSGLHVAGVGSLLLAAELRHLEVLGDGLLGPEGFAHEEETAPQAPPGRPFLIIDGSRHVNLTQPVVSVGRALDNDVIIEDPCISRHHAQFRQRYGHYVLHDLDSTGGTKINDYPIEECMLHSGDVISFAGVEIIYGEDPPTPIPLPANEDTPALTSAESEV